MKPWPTPTASDSKGSRRETARAADWTSKAGETLLDSVRTAQPVAWPTPTAAIATAGPKRVREGGPKQQIDLKTAIASWPTPLASDSKRLGADSEPGQFQDLPAAVRLCPTPTATRYGSQNNGDPHDGRGEYATKGSPSLETMAVRGELSAEESSLNPAWVACLMGFDADWIEPVSKQLDLFGGGPQALTADERAPVRRWPAGPDQPPHDWEPPRTAEYVAERGEKLHGLGNAVVPQCAEVAGEELLAFLGWEPE